jgi:flagellar basal body rod protein FlgF
MTPKPGDTVYVTKRALTVGIEKGVVQQVDDSSRGQTYITIGHLFLQLDRDAFMTFEDAKCRAYYMRTAAIQIAERKLAKLKAMSFEEKE